MNRESTATLVVASLVTGFVAVVLTAATGTGAGGAYGFLFLGLCGLGIFLLWPDLRARISAGGSKRVRPTVGRPRATSRGRRHGTRAS